MKGGRNSVYKLTQVLQREPQQWSNWLKLDDPWKQSDVLRNVSCSCKVCVSSTSIAVADSATRHKNICFQSFTSTASTTIKIHISFFNPLFPQRAPPYTNTRLIFQPIPPAARATIQTYVSFFNPLFPFQAPSHTHTKIKKHVWFFNPFLPQRAPPYKNTSEFSIHYLHSERHRT